MSFTRGNSLNLTDQIFYHNVYPSVCVYFSESNPIQSNICLLQDGKTQVTIN